DVVVSGPPIAFAAVYLWLAVKSHLFALDYAHEVWPAGHRVLAGASPVGPTTAEGLRRALQTNSALPHPAPAALAIAPFSLLPVHVATGLFFTMLVASALLALYAVGVRDWRCYMAIFLWSPVLSALQTANFTLLLVLLAALVWRY